MRTWIFRILTVLGTGLFVLSWLLPWWRTYIMEPELYMEYMQVSPWGLLTSLPIDYRPYYNPWLMPDWWPIFAWAFFGVLVAAMLFSLIAKDKVFNIFGKIKISLPTLCILGVGVLYILTLAICVTMVYIKVNQFTPGFKLVGDTFISLGGAIEGTMHAQFEMGYWVACGTAILIIILALLRNKIMGKN